MSILETTKEKTEGLADKNHYFLMYKMCVMKSLNYIVLEAIYAQRTPQLEAISLAGRLFPGWFWRDSNGQDNKDSLNSRSAELTQSKRQTL